MDGIEPYVSGRSAGRGGTKQSSFFDEISCDALDGRGRMHGGRGGERTRNTETFGATSVALVAGSRRYGGRGGGGYSSYAVSFLFAVVVVVVPTFVDFVPFFLTVYFMFVHTKYIDVFKKSGVVMVACGQRDLIVTGREGEGAPPDRVSWVGSRVAGAPEG